MPWMRGCIEDEDALDKLSGGMKKTTPDELAPLRTVSTPRQKSLLNLGINHEYAPSIGTSSKEANVALSSFKSIAARRIFMASARCVGGGARVCSIRSKKMYLKRLKM